MNKIIRTILSLLIVLTNLDVRILFAQVILPYTPVMQVTLTAPVIINSPLVTPSVFENEKLMDLSAISFSFSKTDIVSLSGSLDESNDLYSSFVNSAYEIRNTRRPSAYGIIRADQLNSPIAYLLRQRFSFETRLKHARFDEYLVETLSVVRKLRLRTDYQGRRVQKIVSNWSGVAWVPLTTKRFVYDGWNVLEEQGTTSKYFIWGVDLSQTMQDAGGVGGLLTQVDVGAVKSYAYLYDGNGNVGQLIDNSDGSIDAHYEYDPYGNSILASGTAAVGNPYRFSTKYLDSDYSLYYYDYRYFDPNTGRWLNRDPLNEFGGLNLYGFVFNAPTDLIDIDGLRVYEPLVKSTGRKNVGKFFGRVATTEVKEIGEKAAGKFAKRIAAAELEPTFIGEIVVIGLTIKDLLTDNDDENRLHVTYLFFDDCGQVRYAGRTSQGKITFADLERQIQYDIAVLRATAHHREEIRELKTFSPDKSAYGGDEAEGAIRGREQQLIDANGGAFSDNRDTPLYNRIRGVRKTHPLGRKFHNLSNTYFLGELHEFTGYF